MRTLTYQLRDLKKVTIEIGFEGENNRTQVRIDCGEVFAEYPNAEAAMKVQAPKGGIYPVTVTRDGDMILWTVRDCDVANNGNGEFQLTFTDGETVVKSCRGRIHIDKSLKGSGTAPSGVQDWLDRAEDALEQVESAEIHQPMIGLDGYWYKWDQEEQQYVTTGEKARGEDGDPGQPGTDATPDLITVPYEDLTFPVAAGTKCYHGGKLYEANQEIQTSEQWTAAHWTETTVEEQLNTVKNAIDGQKIVEKQTAKITDSENAQIVQYGIIKNLYDVTKIVTGGYYDIDGTWKSESNYASSDLIDVREYDSITYVNRNTNTMALKFNYYDGNGDFISGENNYKNSSDPKVVTIDTRNIGYIRFATKYEEYRYSSINVFLFTNDNTECVLSNGNLYVNERSADITDLLNTAFADSRIISIYLGVGEYFIHDTIDVKNGKNLVMTGKMNMYINDVNTVERDIISIVRPINLNGYIFYLGNETTIEGGFIDCSFMATGGCVYIDGAWRAKEGIQIKTNMFGNFNFDLIAVYINGDRLTESYPGGHVTNINLDSMISGYGCGLKVERHDTDTSDSKFCWMTDINVHGYMNTCQRYIYYDVDSQVHAGGGSLIDCVIQGGIVPDSSIPAVDVCGDCMTLAVLFHDVNFESYAPQKVKYHLVNVPNSTISSYGVRRGSQNITGNYESAKFILDRQYHEITEIEDYSNNEIRETSYWNRVENIVKIYLRARLCTTTTWTKLMTLPFEARTMKRFSAVNDDGTRLLFYVSGTDLMYQASQTANCSLSFDYVLKEYAQTGVDV